MKKQSFEAVKEGDKRVFSKVITERDIEAFAAVTGDFNPIHLDGNFARRTIFRGKIAHGLLVGGLISTALTKFPGVIVYISQTLDFLKPVRVGDKIEALAEVLGKIDERSELRLKTICKNQRGETVVNGEARIKILEVKDSGEESPRKEKTETA